MLFNSLVKTSLAREDVANMEKENVKNSHEIKQTLRSTSKAHDSYTYRTSVELVAAISLAVFFSSFSGIKGLNRPLFDCDVHNILFKCIIPNSRFYQVCYHLFLWPNCQTAQIPMFVNKISQFFCDPDLVSAAKKLHIWWKYYL